MGFKGGFDDSFVARVKEASDIVATISRYIVLSKKGKTFWGCCPFHLEKTPSFAVNEQEQFYHCFGCGESGDVIKFVQKHENCDFMKALEILAKQAGIEMPKILFDDSILAKKRQKEQIYKVNKEAALHYYNNLFTKQGEPALNYLLERGISKGTITAFGLGVSLGWQQVVDHLAKKGFSKNDMILAGVVDEKNGRVYDAFAERVIFPLVDVFGEVVGFSARTLKKDANVAKYKNTKETPVFSKGGQSKSDDVPRGAGYQLNYIFGMNLVKKQKQKEGLTEIVLVEGQMDVIKLYEAGFKNAVACLGTAFTNHHAREIKRFADKVVVCFDGDEAGQKATIRSLEVLQQCEGLNVKIAAMPPGIDPDDFIQQKGSEEFRKLLSESCGPVDYLLTKAAQKYNLKNNEEKSQYTKEALEILKKRGSSIDCDIYLETISALSGVQMSTLRRELAQEKIASVGVAATQKEVRNQDAFVRACKFYLASLLAKKEYAVLVASKYFKFGDNMLQKIYNFAKNGKQISLIFDEFNINESPQIDDILNEGFRFDNYDDEEKYFKGCVATILLKNMEAEKSELLKQRKIEEMTLLENKIEETKKQWLN